MTDDLLTVDEGGAARAAPERAPEASPVRVRKIGHVVYEVSDIEASTRFWTEIMGFSVSDRNEFGMVFLRSAADHHSVALKPCPGRERPLEDPDALRVDHFAMEVDSLESLFEIRAFLQRRGVAISFEGRRGPGCNIGVEFRDPDNYLLELYVGMDQIGPDGRSRPAEQFRRATSLEDAVNNPLPARW